MAEKCEEVAQSTEPTNSHGDQVAETACEKPAGPSPSKLRLTLRTLLAYLDDQRDQADFDIKDFSQRVAESDAAQELITRIKEITRRRLTTPPATGPGAVDSNTVAEYLDNVLPPDQVCDLEKTCLESDVHLAEIAACHQIHTLVLSQPALVPSTALPRMYGLVEQKGGILSSLKKFFFDS